MEILEQLATTQDPVIRGMIKSRRESALEENDRRPNTAVFDNQPTWDNWSKKPDEFKKKTHYFKKK